MMLAAPRDTPFSRQKSAFALNTSKTSKSPSSPWQLLATIGDSFPRSSRQQRRPPLRSDQETRGSSGVSRLGLLAKRQSSPRRAVYNKLSARGGSEAILLACQCARPNSIVGMDRQSSQTSRQE